MLGRMPGHSRRTVPFLAAAGLSLAGIPLLAAPAQAGLSCDWPLQLPLDDCVAPESVITTKPQTVAQTTAAKFDVTTETPEKNVRFECRLEGPVPTAWTDCTVPPAQGATTSAGTALYTGLTEGIYTFSVRASDKPVLGTPNVEQTPATYQFEVLPPDPVDDGEDPRTTISSAPDRWHLFDYASVEYASSEAPLGFRCTMNGAETPCTGSEAQFRGLTPGDYTFTVAAVDQTGNIDPSPARTRFTVPKSSPQFSPRFSPEWEDGQGRGHLRDSYKVTDQKGATFRRKFVGVRSLLLVVTKAPNNGVLRVSVNKKVVKRINLAAATRTTRLGIPIVSVAKPQDLLLQFDVVSPDGKEVLVEAIGSSLWR